jgi:hypothetical protein
LTDSAIEKIAANVEGFRARSIAARQANLVRSFEREAARQGVPVVVLPNSHLYVHKTDKKGRRRKIAVIPTIGVPVSTNFHDAFIEYGGQPSSAALGSNALGDRMVVKLDNGTERSLSEILSNVIKMWERLVEGDSAVQQ